MADDFYRLLGVSASASQAEIKSAYRKLAMQLHPDSAPDDAESEEAFKNVSRAYEVLSDPERRRRYDAFGPEAAGAGRTAGERSEPFGQSGLGDIFDAFFGGAGMGGFGGGGPAGPPRGNDVEFRLAIDLEEAVFGVESDINIKVPVQCETCSATGAAPGTEAVTCSQCEGTGQVQRVRSSFLGQMVTAAVCSVCGGTGAQIPHPCPDCRGEGRRTQPVTHEVQVPAGVEDGMTVRLTGLGAAGPRGGLSGDLYVHITVKEHDRFTRDGDNLIGAIHICIAQASLGTSLIFETLDGSVDLDIAPGSQSGSVMRLRDKGAHRLGKRGRGDLLIRVIVDVPAELSEAEESKLREFAALRGTDVSPPESGLVSRIKSALK